MSEDAGIRVRFQPSGRTALVSQGATVAQAAAAAGIAVRSPCGGMGTCGKCLVRIRSGRTADSESDAAPDAARRAEGWRLACRTRLFSDCVVEIPETSAEATAQRILATDAGTAKTAPPQDPAIEVVDVSPPPPTRDDARPDAKRIAEAAGRPLRFPRATLAALPATARGAVWRLRLACSADGEVAAVLPASAGDASR